ncbi:mediator-associated protein 3 [Ricinus communis]|uniref:mediator-associated protein 3 n=1 Tax=Ricinus communis TaxID=3988 RepID=UPI00201AD61C|nr:mediator-associated protein 3 [Ricinus communis]
MEPEVSRELEKKIAKRVRKILERENLYQMTEKKVREIASKELEISLVNEPFKAIVSRAVEDFLVKLRNQTQKTSLQVQEEFKAKRRSK